MKKDDRSARRRDSAGRLLRKDGQIDRRRPPPEHRFKPRQSGNPKGRPKGAKSTDTIVHDILNRKIEIRVSGTLRKISLREAILTRFTEDALKGNPKSATFLLNRYDAFNAVQQTDENASEHDQELIDAFVKNLLKNVKEKR